MVGFPDGVTREVFYPKLYRMDQESLDWREVLGQEADESAAGDGDDDVDSEGECHQDIKHDDDDDDEAVDAAGDRNPDGAHGFTHEDPAIQGQRDEYLASLLRQNTFYNLLVLRQEVDVHGIAQASKSVPRGNQVFFQNPEV